MNDRISRRLLVVRVTTLGGASVALSACVVPPGPAFYAPTQVLVPRGTGLTDADPSDGPGNGRGVRRASGVTDRDPNDGPGNGRGGFRGTGITDRDPNDGPGNGRGGFRRSGRTDSDPRDAPGRGRF